MKIFIGPSEHDLDDLVTQLKTDLLAINAEIGGLQLLQERKRQTLELLHTIRKSSPE